MRSKFLKYERLDRKAAVDLFGESFGLEVNWLLENNSRSDRFDGARGSDIFHAALASNAETRKMDDADERS
jgi:hypothetical protein